MIALVDGTVIAATLDGDGEWAAAVLAEPPAETMSDEEVDAFRARAANAQRLGGEVRYLEEIAEDGTIDGLSEAEEQRARRLASALDGARADDPTLVAVRSA